MAIPLESVLVTGASGFLGRHVCADLGARGLRVIPSGRAASAQSADTGTQVQFDLEDPRGPDPLRLRGVDAIVHLAARVHVMDSRAHDASHFDNVNVAATRRLAEVASAAGVRRFVFMSTVKVHGEGRADRPYRADDAPDPADAYARSKHRAELALGEIAARGGMQVVVIRPPLVYGPGVGGNFLRMLRWVGRGWPLPLGRASGLRSYVSAWNLADLVHAALVHPGAAGRAWLVTDGPPISTAELARRLGEGLGRPAWLLDVPERSLMLAAELLGRGPDVARLCRPLVVDDEPTRVALGWNPPRTLDSELARTASWFREAQAQAQAQANAVR